MNKFDLEDFTRQGFVFAGGEGDGGDGGDGGTDGGNGGGDATGPFDSFENKDIAKWATDKGIKSSEAGLTSYKELESKMGSKIDPPSTDWGDDQWKGFGDKTRPASKDLYDVKIPENLTGRVNTDLIEATKEAAFKDGMPAQWFNKHINGFLESQSNELKTVEAKANDLIAADNKTLREDPAWVDKFDENTELSKRGWESIATEMKVDKDEFAKFAKDIGYDTHPIWKKIGLYIGKLHGDATPGGGPNASNTADPNAVMSPGFYDKPTDG